MSFNGSVALDTVTGLGPDTGFSMDAYSCAIINAFGGASPQRSRHRCRR